MVRVAFLLISFVALTACMRAPAGDYCDIARTKYFGGVGTIEWLVRNDRPLLAQIVSENETRRELCDG
jgi:hypothetical protein